MVHPPTTPSCLRDGRVVMRDTVNHKDDLWFIECTTDEKEPKETRVCDYEWEHVFTLPGRCSIDLVCSVLDVQDRAYQRGATAGEETVRQAVRRLIGAAPLPREGDEP